MTKSSFDMLADQNAAQIAALDQEELETVLPILKAAIADETKIYHEYLLGGADLSKDTFLSSGRRSLRRRADTAPASGRPSASPEPM